MSRRGSGLFAAALLAGAAAGGAAQAEPMVVAGGALDPAYPGADVYLEKPAEPDVPPGRACAVAARYVELVNAGDYAGVAALYADDATFLEPMRPNLKGREQIDAFYTQRIGAMMPRIAAVSYLGNARECMVALALETPIDARPRWVLVSVDHFLVDDAGRIESMAAFARPVREQGE